MTVSNVTEVTAKVMASEAQLEAALQAQGADEATAAATYNTLLAGLCQAQGALSLAGSMSSEETGAGLGQLATGYVCTKKQRKRDCKNGGRISNIDKSVAKWLHSRG